MAKRESGASSSVIRLVRTKGPPTLRKERDDVNHDVNKSIVTSQSQKHVKVKVKKSHTKVDVGSSKLDSNLGNATSRSDENCSKISAVCDACGKTFTDETLFKQHQATHIFGADFEELSEFVAAVPPKKANKTHKKQKLSKSTVESKKTKTIKLKRASVLKRYDEDESSRSDSACMMKQPDMNDSDVTSIADKRFPVKPRNKSGNIYTVTDSKLESNTGKGYSFCQEPSATSDVKSSSSKQMYDKNNQSVVDEASQNQSIGSGSNNPGTRTSLLKGFITKPLSTVASFFKKIHRQSTAEDNHDNVNSPESDGTSRMLLQGSTINVPKTEESAKQCRVTTEKSCNKQTEPDHSENTGINRTLGQESDTTSETGNKKKRSRSSMKQSIKKKRNTDLGLAETPSKVENPSKFNISSQRLFTDTRQNGVNTKINESHNKVRKKRKKTHKGDDYCNTDSSTSEANVGKKRVEDSSPGCSPNIKKRMRLSTAENIGASKKKKKSRNKQTSENAKSSEICKKSTEKLGIFESIASDLSSLGEDERLSLRQTDRELENVSDWNELGTVQEATQSSSVVTKSTCPQVVRIRECDTSISKSGDICENPISNDEVKLSLQKIDTDKNHASGLRKKSSKIPKIRRYSVHSDINEVSNLMTQPPKSPYGAQSIPQHRRHSVPPSSSLKRDSARSLQSSFVPDVPTERLLSVSKTPEVIPRLETAEQEKHAQQRLFKNVRATLQNSNLFTIQETQENNSKGYENTTKSTDSCSSDKNESSSIISDTILSHNHSVAAESVPVIQAPPISNIHTQSNPAELVPWVIKEQACAAGSTAELTTDHWIETGSENVMEETHRILPVVIKECDSTENDFESNCGHQKEPIEYTDNESPFVHNHPFNKYNVHMGKIDDDATDTTVNDELTDFRHSDDTSDFDCPSYPNSLHTTSKRIASDTPENETRRYVGIAEMNVRNQLKVGETAIFQLGVEREPGGNASGERDDNDFGQSSTSSGIDSNQINPTDSLLPHPKNHKEDFGNNANFRQSTTENELSREAIPNAKDSFEDATTADSLNNFESNSEDMLCTKDISENVTKNNDLSNIQTSTELWTEDGSEDDAKTGNSGRDSDQMSSDEDESDEESNHPKSIAENDNETTYDCDYGFNHSSADGTSHIPLKTSENNDSVDCDLNQSSTNDGESDVTTKKSSTAGKISQKSHGSTLKLPTKRATKRDNDLKKGLAYWINEDIEYTRKAMEDDGKPRPYECLQCMRTFISQESLVNHYLVHMGGKSYPCKVCGRTFMTLASLKYHKYAHRIQDNIRLLERYESESVEPVPKRIPAPKTFSCTICNQKFVTKSQYVLHTKAPKAGFSCQICIEVFECKGLLFQHHLGTHKNISSDIVCAECGEKFHKASHLKNHIKVHSTRSKYVCLVCGKLFSLKRPLKDHIAMHGHICEVCGHSFTNRLALRNHAKFHRFEKEMKSVCISKAGTSDTANTMVAEDVADRERIVGEDNSHTEKHSAQNTRSPDNDMPKGNIAQKLKALKQKIAMEEVIKDIAIYHKAESNAGPQNRQLQKLKTRANSTNKIATKQKSLTQCKEKDNNTITNLLSGQIKNDAKLYHVDSQHSDSSASSDKDDWKPPEDASQESSDEYSDTESSQRKQKCRICGRLVLNNSALVRHMHVQHRKQTLL